MTAQVGDRAVHEPGARAVALELCGRLSRRVSSHAVGAITSTVPRTVTAFTSRPHSQASKTKANTICVNPTTDTLTVAGVNLGSIDLQLSDYISGGNVTFSSSSMALSGGAVTITYKFFHYRRIPPEQSTVVRVPQRIYSSANR